MSTSLRTLALTAAGLALLAGGTAGLIGRGQPRQLGVQPDASVLVPSNQTLTPAGTLRRTEGVRPKDLAVSPDGKTVAVLTTSRVLFFDAQGAEVGGVSLTAGPLGLAWAPDGEAVYASGGNGRVYRLQMQDGKWAAAGDFPVESGAETAAARQAKQPANPQVTGLAVSRDAKRLFVGLGIRNAVAVLRLPDMSIEQTVRVGAAPYSLALSPDGRVLVAANRGGAPVDAPADDAADSAGTLVRVDPRTDAVKRGSLSFINTADLSATSVDAGRQPAGMAFSPDGKALFVANSDEDTVSEWDPAARRPRRTFSIRPPEDPGFGQIPTSVTLSQDGKRLFVACGGANSVAVVELGQRPRISGYIPAGWFPIALQQRGEALYVASSKGIGARPENAAGKYRVHASVGLVQFLKEADYGDLRALTQQVAANNRWGQELPPRPGRAPVPVPERVGEPSVFKHVVYIIKENHTYDLTLGDMPEGNGDKSLCTFPEEVTPNQHALAREFVLLDNTYTSGTNSADGHQWTMSGVANSYIEHNYGAHSRSYPYDGGDPLAYSPEGFLWTQALDKGLSVRVYGEWVNKPKVVDPATGRTPNFKQLWDDYRAGTNKYQITADTDNARLKPHIHPRFIGFPSIVSDQWRADQYLADLKQFEATGKMPSLSVLLLPNDHTAGTRPGMPTPRAAVADNDLATGRIIEAISKSKFWKETLILVMEDDSQLGIDHVDGHRTIAYCASPYTKRKTVISEPYNHTSFIRTIGLVLGFPAMNRFDRTATPMTAVFTDKPDFTPFTHRPANLRLDELNPPARALRGEARKLAEACDALDWSDVDRADASVVARAVWHSQRPGQPFPWRAYHPIEEEEDDDE